jgi:hypothetical protein
MFAENNRALSRVTPMFFALWVGNTVELSNFFEWAGIPREKEQLHLVEVELKVVGQHPS